MTHVLYIIARNDLDSMNPGKLSAQASHASNAFVKKFHETMRSSAVQQNSIAERLNKDFFLWETSTEQGFGTVIVLESEMKDIYPVIDVFKKLGYISDVIHDPSYPILDGRVVHHIPLDTCSYVFVPNKEDDYIAKILLSRFSLYR
jgi:peptidyl-tRNA hydrolase